MKSWKTTVGGIGMILSGIALGIKIVTTNNYSPEALTAALTAVSGGFGLIFARDNNVTSEAVGAKTEVK